ncbi:MAG: hypothetical protein H0V66_03075, partial [Bdellovibrionales bacterium]|nr:hypothetical protein [Bdellovibrionales bacterium]
MLDRIKKRTFEGFKEFVLNMETTGTTSRSQILMAGILEDPIFMTYVMKNVRTFEDFIDLPSDEIDTVIKTQEQIIGVLAKCIYGMPEDKILAFENNIPKHISKLKDELSYLKEVTPSEKEGAKYFILKIVRKLQQQEQIQGFKWHLPPQDMFHPKILKDGQFEIYFETGVLAAEGQVLKGKRSDAWKHFYDSGKLMAEGQYNDGLKTGVWVIYFGNGSIKAQGKYKADLKHGQWR